MLVTQQQASLRPPPVRTNLSPIKTIMGLKRAWLPLKAAFTEAKLATAGATPLQLIASTSSRARTAERPMTFCFESYSVRVHRIR